MELTTWERLTVAAVVGEIRGTAGEIRAAGQVLDLVEFNQADAAAIALKADNGVVTWANNGANVAQSARVWDIPLEAHLPLIAKALGEFTGFSARNRREVAALLDKCVTARAEAGARSAAAAAGAPPDLGEDLQITRRVPGLKRTGRR